MMGTSIFHSRSAPNTNKGETPSPSNSPQPNSPSSRSPNSPSLVSELINSVNSDRNEKIEGDATVSLLHVAEYNFPTIKDSYLNNHKNLYDDSQIRNVEFSKSSIGSAFTKGMNNYKDMTLSPLASLSSNTHPLSHPPPPAKGKSLETYSFEKTTEYCNAKADKVETDILLKFGFDSDQTNYDHTWCNPIAVPNEYRLRFIAEKQEVECMGVSSPTNFSHHSNSLFLSPDHVPLESKSIIDTKGVFAIPPLDTLSSSSTIINSSFSVASATSNLSTRKVSSSSPHPNIEPQSSSPSSIVSTTGTSISDRRKSASMYIIGEVFAPFTEDSSKFHEKLLQAERSLQIILAIEKKTNVRECVLGFVFLSPSMTTDLCRTFYNTLHHYKIILPCLWSLQGNNGEKRCRLLAQRVRSLSPSLKIYAGTNTINEINVKVTNLESKADILDEKVSNLESKADILDEKVTVIERDVGTLTTDLGTVKENVGTLTTDLAKLTNTVSLIQTTLEVIIKKLDNKL